MSESASLSPDAFDPEVGALAMVFTWLAGLRPADHARLAERLHRVDARLFRRDPVLALGARWASPADRRQLLTWCRASLRPLVAAIRRHGGAVVHQEWQRGLPGPACAWLLQEAGTDPIAWIRDLSPPEQQRYAAQADHWGQVHRALTQVEQARAADHARGRERRARQVRDLQWALDHARAKHARAEAALAAAARDRAALAAERDALRVRVADLEAQLADAWAAQRAAEEQRDALARQQADALRDQPDPPVPDLRGRTVLVVGDPNRLDAYRQLVEQAHGVFAFAEGFATVRDLTARAAAADVVIAVTAFLSHTQWALIREAGTPVVVAPVAGQRAVAHAVAVAARL